MIWTNQLTRVSGSFNSAVSLPTDVSLTCRKSHCVILTINTQTDGLSGYMTRTISHFNQFLSMHWHQFSNYKTVELLHFSSQTYKQCKVSTVAFQFKVCMLYFSCRIEKENSLMASVWIGWVRRNVWKRNAVHHHCAVSQYVGQVLLYSISATLLPHHVMNNA